MRKFLKIAGVILAILFLFLFWALEKVDFTPYFNCNYYENTCSRLDSTCIGLSIAQEKVFIGFGKKSITPGLNAKNDNPEKGIFNSVPLAGFGNRRGKNAEGIHDSIFVKTMAVKVQEKLFVFIGSDMLIVPPVVADGVIKTLHTKHALEQEQLFFTATHTHSGIGAWSEGLIGKEFAGSPNPEIIRWLIQQFSEAIESAINNLQPGKIGNGNFRTGNLLWNRMIWDKGEKNSVFTFLLAQQDTGKRVIIGSFDAHPTTLGDWNMQISGDYPGYRQRKLENSGFDMAIFSAGSVGSQGPRRKKEKFETAEYLGETLADSVLKYSNSVKLYDSISLSGITLRTDLPPLQVRATDGLKLRPYLAKKLFPVMGSVNIQAARIGNLIWFTSPGDFSGELAIELKNSGCREGYNVLVTSFNGAYLGYILPEKYYHYNDYESRIMSWFGPYLGPYNYEIMHRMMQKLSSL